MHTLDVFLFFYCDVQFGQCMNRPIGLSRKKIPMHWIDQL